MTRVTAERHLDGVGPIPPARPEPRRDQYGRYVIPDPVTGEERSWVRATTWAKSIADTFALTKWELRMAALGLAQRQDLLVGVAAVLDPDSVDGKRKLDRLIEQAKEAARSSARATLGTALHAFAEAYDTGRKVTYIPQPFDQDLLAYERELARHQLQVSRNYVEKIGLVHKLGVAGTMDRVVALPRRPLPLVGDVKTGKDLDYSWTEIAIQLALYAHADTVFDPVEGHHRRMLQVDREQALVIHLPAGEGRCQLHLVDIASGWVMAQVCGQVREWRNRKDLAQPLNEPEGRTMSDGADAPA